MSTLCIDQNQLPNLNLDNSTISNAIKNEVTKFVATNFSLGNKLLTIFQANTWMQRAKDKKLPSMLFDVFWHEDELCILFADTNLGKSILAVQIADSISKGIAIKGFRLNAAAQQVLYLDFELSEKQFENRYSINYEQSYDFHPNFLRAELNPEADIIDRSKSFEDYLIESIEEYVKSSGVKVLIIDNLTYLGSDNEKAKDALPLMKRLQSLKKQYGLSILVLAHTPKRDPSKPITVNDVQGSKMLMNFCDSAFAIGRSTTDEKLRYIKQIKQRNTEQVYGDDNVCLCQIVKPSNFLQFELISLTKEWEHLRQPSADDREVLIQEVKKLSQQGMSQRDIAQKMCISVGSVNNYLKH